MSVFFFLKKKSHKILMLILILATLYSMVFMYSRAAYLATVAGMLWKASCAANLSRLGSCCQ